MPVSRPKPKREIHPASRCCPSRSASVIAPTLDERARISATVIVSVPRGSASWMIRSATWIWYGSTKLVDGETRLADSEPAPVRSFDLARGSHGAGGAGVRHLAGCVRDGPLPPWAPGELAVERELEPGEAAVVDARIAEHLRCERALRVEAPLLRIEPEPGQVLTLQDRRPR